MVPTTRLLGFAGHVCLAASALATLCGVGVVGWLLLASPTAPRVMAAMMAFGLAIGCGLTGVVLRKRAAGTLLPSDVDLSVGFRGGQGGL